MEQERKLIQVDLSLKVNSKMVSCIKGRNLISSGQVAIGNFKSGLSNGEGEMTLPGVSVAKGEFFDGRLHGKGVTVYSKGIILEGEFKNGYLDKGEKILVDTYSGQAVLRDW